MYVLFLLILNILFNNPLFSLLIRGRPESLLIGLLIALPSGIGVALSVLGNNTSSLVGVAISAALLPPLVNSGFSVGIAIIAAIERTDIDGNVKHTMLCILEASLIHFDQYMLIAYFGPFQKYELEFLW